MVRWYDSSGDAVGVRYDERVKSAWASSTAIKNGILEISAVRPPSRMHIDSWYEDEKHSLSLSRQLRHHTLQHTHSRTGHIRPHSQFCELHQPHPGLNIGFTIKLVRLRGIQLGEQGSVDCEELGEDGRGEGGLVECCSCGVVVV